MVTYVTGGPPRYAHQKKALASMITNRGVSALLLEPGMGKRLAVDTNVDTPKGSRRFGDLNIGDYVLGRDGRPTPVLGIYSRGTGIAYRVRFSDGASVVCDADHLWTVASEYLWNQGKWRTLPLARLMRKPLLRSNGVARWFIPWSEPQELDGLSRYSLPYDHYAVGVRLSHGYETEFPRDYLNATVDQRKALLAGLIDTRGTFRPQYRIGITTPHLNIASGIVTLVRSLGGLAKGRLSLDDHGRELFRIRLWVPFNPYTDPYKAKQYVPRPWRRGIISVTPEEPTEMMCIKVGAPDGLFAVEHGVITHNTSVVLDYAGLLALASPKRETRALVVSPLVAVDTWVDQAKTFVSPQVGFWAEALGGTLLERAEALASRGGNPYKEPLRRTRETPPAGWFTETETERGYLMACVHCGASKEAVRTSTIDRWWTAHLLDAHQYVSRKRVHQGDPRAVNVHRAVALAHRHAEGETINDLEDHLGPAAVQGPRLVLAVLNFDALASRAQFGSKTMADVMLDAIRRYDPELLVVDESHRIKGPMANASRLLGRAARGIPRRVIMTGTVMPAGPLDVFAQWRVLEPYAFGDTDPQGVRREASLAGFKNRYVNYGGWCDREIIGYKNLDHLEEVMSRHSIVGLKADALDLPPVTDVTLPVRLSPAEQRAYAEMKKSLATRLADGTLTSATNRLTQMLRLRQITSGHVTDDTGTPQVIGTSKIDVISSLVQDTLIGEKRLVIFCHFSHEVRALAEKLSKDKSTEVLVIQGVTPVAERVEIRRRFGSNDPARLVIVAQIKTVSLAVNEFVTASHAIFASLTQQRDDLVQARDRLNRLGQTRPVTFWTAIAQGTVDEIVMKAHNERTSLEAALLKHIAS